MAFDNRTMPTKRKGKPHIALIDGWWRVSSLRWKGKVFRKPPPGVPVDAYKRWGKAHEFVRGLNNNLHWPDPEAFKR